MSSVGYGEARYKWGYSKTDSHKELQSNQEAENPFVCFPANSWSPLLLLKGGKTDFNGQIV
jgi:hypothetical protein